MTKKQTSKLIRTGLALAGVAALQTNATAAAKAKRPGLRVLAAEPAGKRLAEALRPRQARKQRRAPRRRQCASAARRSSSARRNAKRFPEFCGVGN